MSRKRLMASLVVAAGFAARAFAAADLVNGVTAIVNDNVVTYEELQGFARKAMEAVVMRNPRITQADLDRELMAVQKDSLETLIDRRLIVADFKTVGGQLPESIMDELVNDRIRKDFVDRVTLTKMLRESGRTYANFRKEEAEALIVYQMVRRNVAQEIVVSPRKMERYYAANRAKYKVDDRVHVRMILVDARKHGRGEPATIAAEALARIRAGAEFATIAGEMSDDARNNKGGDRGWITASGKELRKELADAAFALAPGGVTGVIEIEGSAYILKSEAKEAAHERTLAEMRNEIEATLKQQERDRLQKAWLARLRKKAYVRYF